MPWNWRSVGRLAAAHLRSRPRWLIRAFDEPLLQQSHRHTHPIERASGDYSADPKQRNLQLEAAPISRSRNGSMLAVLTRLRLRLMPFAKFTVASVNCFHPSFSVVTDPSTKEDVPVIPGALRERDGGGPSRCDQPRRGAAFLERMHDVYRKPARSTRSWQRLARIIAFSGSTPSLTVTGAWRASCPMPC